MGLVKRTYVDQETVITAENLNAIQDAIIENEEAIEDQGEAIEGKYAKPSGGIPSTDLASAVQTSLGKADTAYQKPSGGIPGTDLASAVQTSLGKANTALQSSDIDNTLTVTGKAADAKKTGDEISGLKNTLNQLDEGLAIHKTGDTADAAISYGTFIHLTGNSSPSLPDGLYQVTASGGISSGASYTTSNLTKQSTVGGGLNVLNNKLTKSFLSFTAGTGVTIVTQNNIWFDSLGILFANIFIQVTTAVAKNNAVVSLPSGKKFVLRTDIMLHDGTELAALSTSGDITANTQALPVGIYIISAVLYV